MAPLDDKSLYIETNTLYRRNQQTVAPFDGRSVRHHALNPLWTELQGLLGMVTQACADASDICSSRILALQMLAMDRMCFIPYWDRDPQCVSNVRTCTYDKSIPFSYNVQPIIGKAKNNSSLKFSLRWFKSILSEISHHRDKYLFNFFAFLVKNGDWNTNRTLLA